MRCAAPTGVALAGAVLASVLAGGVVGGAAAAEARDVDPHVRSRTGPGSIGGTDARRALLVPPFLATAAPAPPRERSPRPEPPSTAAAAVARAVPTEPAGAAASRRPLVPAPVFWAVVAVATVTIGGRLGRRARRNLSAPPRGRRAA